MKTFTLSDGFGLQVPSSAQVIHPTQFQRQGTSGAKPNDPLAGMTPWQTYQRCIWVSDEDANTKISLLAISRYMDKDLHASSMSYAQIARDCGFSEATAKRCAKATAGIWLKIGIGKGRYVPGKGHENLYDGIVPERWVNELRRRMLGGIQVRPDEAIAKAANAAMSGPSGVSHRYPGHRGVSERHPEKLISGCQADTGVSDSSKRGVTQTHLLQIPPEEEKSSSAASSEAAHATLPLGDEPAQQAGKEPGTKSSKKRAAGDLGTRWPKGQAVPEEWSAWAAREFRVSPGDIRREASTFADWWPAKAGKDASKLDWGATWRNWCRRAFKGKERIDANAQPAADLGADLDAQIEQARRERRGRP